jgi:hypothetical protein
LADVSRNRMPYSSAKPLPLAVSITFVHRYHGQPISA